jgi:hypothetical protein
VNLEEYESSFSTKEKKGPYNSLSNMISNNLKDPFMDPGYGNIVLPRLR